MTHDSRLCCAMRAGHIILRNEEFIGIAADGIEVSMGYSWPGKIGLTELQRIENYLSQHPTPDTW